jgi:hypothetical protein
MLKLGPGLEAFGKLNHNMKFLKNKTTVQEKYHCIQFKIWKCPIKLLIK